MPWSWLMLSFTLPFLIIAAAVAAYHSILPPQANFTSLPGCPSACDDVQIPYPFGIGPNCFREGFGLTCETAANGTVKPFLSGVEIIKISLAAGQVQLYNQISWQCYDQSSGKVQSRRWSLDFSDLPYRFSDTRNRFMTIGCDTLAYIKGRKGDDVYQSGCVSVCDDPGRLADGSCSGIGCCQTAIPNGIDYYEVAFDAGFNNSRVWPFDPCSYAVLADEDWFEFRTGYVTSGELNRTNGGRVPIVVDWAIGEQQCEVARQNKTGYACASKHSDCVDSMNGPGYLCNCSKGYQGNPYLKNGCEDIDECSMKEEYPCYGVCTNKPGSYSCECPRGTNGDPTVAGACYPDYIPWQVQLTLGFGISFLLILCLGLVIYVLRERRQLKELKEIYFRRNGGWILLEEIKSQQSVSFKIFTKGELERATNNFDKKHIIGGGSHGTVYYGILIDNRAVAIKKSMIVNERQKKEFVNEMLILSQINHKNIVKLLGCCLEVEVPMLIYEFVPNGTVFQFIHQHNEKSSISLDARLQIASESAEALAYLHSAASPPILHGDVKSSNILLDENYTAKVSDFGASMLVPKDESQFATLVQGTLGYLDPEYLQTSQLTDRSDVYSFGVVLLELLTGKKALYFEESGTERSLASSFMFAMKRNKLLEFLDYTINDEVEEKLIGEVAKLAKLCLNVRGEERPAMREVAEELDRLRKTKQQVWVQQRTVEIIEHPWLQDEEIQGLLGESLR